MEHIPFGLTQLIQTNSTSIFFFFGEKSPKCNIDSNFRQNLPFIFKKQVTKCHPFFFLWVGELVATHLSTSYTFNGHVQNYLELSQNLYGGGLPLLLH